jgi:hypothetical protein
VSGSIFGQAGLFDGNSDFNAITFLVKQILARVNTATLVQVEAVTNSGGVSPVGTVDVLPLVNQIDGEGNGTPHDTVYGLPYLRMQGGANAIIIDPQVGDIGVAIFASRDISSVKASKGQANPGSFRRFSMADGLYFGGFLGAAPTQYVQFSATGVNIVCSGALTFQSSNARLDQSGNLSITGDVVSGVISLQSHVHSVPTAPGISGPPSG